MFNKISILFISIIIIFLWHSSEVHAVSYKCGVKCAKCEDGDETRCYKCNESFRRFERNGSYKICLETCDYSHQFEQYEGRNLECKECDQGCYSGCNGSSREVRAGGCFKCKLGILDGENKICLNDTSTNNACELNGYSDYFVEKLTEENIGWASAICKQCHANCERCVKFGTHPELHKCVCKTFELIDGPNTYCSENCPADFHQIPHPQNASYKRCIRCQTGYHLNPLYAICVEDNASIIISIAIITGIVFLLSILIIVAVYKFIKNNPSNKKSKLKKMVLINNRSDEPSNQRLLPNRTPAKNKLEKEKVQLIMGAIESQDKEVLVSGESKQCDYVYLEKLGTKQQSSSDIIILDNELTKGELLGEGNFSEVYKGIFREKEVAIKVIIADEETKAAIREEYKIMLKTNHPHIHSLLGISMGYVLQLVSEIRLGDLKKYLEKNGSNKQIFPNVRRLYLYCAQIAEGMKYLVGQGIVHRDLAARNILVKTIDHVEVSDFGLAKIIGNKKGVKIGGPAPWRWLPIESLTSCEFTFATDVWSYGITCWEIFHFGMRTPYDDNKIVNKHEKESDRKDELQKQLCHGERLRRPEKCDKETYVELVSCWERCPKDRPTFEELSTYFHEVELQMRANEHDYKNIIKTKIQYAEIAPSKTNIQSDCVIQVEENDVPKSTANELTSNPALLNATVDINTSTQVAAYCKKPNTLEHILEMDNDFRISSNSDNLSPISITSTDSGISVSSNFEETKEEFYERLYNDPDLNLIIFPENPSKRYKFNKHDFEDLETIGASRSIVKSCFHKPSERIMAVKYINIHQTRYESEAEYVKRLKHLLREVENFRNLESTSNIVEFYGICVVESHALICMEKMDFSLIELYQKIHSIIKNEVRYDGSARTDSERTLVLEENLTSAQSAVDSFEKETQNAFFPEELFGCLAISILDALVDCKTKEIIHRDIKPKNILLNRMGHIKLCDFGEARILEDSIASTYAETIYYSPPERFDENIKEYDIRTDIWSLGITLVEIVLGHVPFKDSKGRISNNIVMLQKLIKDFNKDQVVKETFSNGSFSDETRNFVKKCLETLERRPKFQGLKETPFYKKFSSFGEEKRREIVVKWLDEYT